ncbi:MAG: anaerobic ribonucleoside-triphosphate reductase, partial [Bacteroidales bacterium]
AEIAESYKAFRTQRDKAREVDSRFIKEITSLINGDSLVRNENANKDAKVFPVQRDLISGIISKHMGRNYVLPPHIVEAHDSGDIHYHDLDYAPFLPMTNCCLVDLKGLLENGFKLGNAQIESPKSIGVACAVMAQITAQVASHQYGGTTFANIDQVLEPYVQASWTKHWNVGMEEGVADVEGYADRRTAKEVFDGIQAYEYEVNTLFTTNGQTPFVTVTFGMGTGKHSRWIQEAILKVRIKGLGKDGITAVFPKLVMFLDKGINLKPEDPNYDIKQLALECSSKRLYPDIISADINRTITKSPVPVSPMGCRSFLGGWKDANGDYTLDGRNNLGVVSVNLPRIAIESGGDFGKFWGVLEGRLALAKEALETRIDSLRGVKASVAPILYTEGAFGVKLHPDDEIIDLFKHGRASISVGYIGIHEVIQLMYPEIDHPLNSPEGQEFGKQVVKELKSAVTKWKEESEEGWGFSLYSTPSESLCDRFCRLDKEKFGEIKGITDKGWYMNSFHFDVDKKVTPFEKIDFEADYHYIANGGHISYAEFPNLRNNLQALESVWDYAMERLAYFGTNTPSDICFDCKFEGEFKATSKGFECPSCGNHDSNKMNVIRRVCGYLGAPNARGFNHGKQQEVIHRVKHMSELGKL